jgi:anti-sigma factor RsiW
MTEPFDLDPAAEADLVALADGCLTPCRRCELEARVAADPAMAAALASQRAALGLLAAAPCATAALRARVDELAAGVPRIRRARFRRPKRHGRRTP